MKIGNPYRPGAGLMPGVLAGREEMIKEVGEIFTALKQGIPVQSMIMCGLRGVGKTVLLNRFEQMAGDMDIYVSHIEIDEEKDFISQIIASCKSFLIEIQSSEKVKQYMKKALDALRSLSISFDPEGQKISLSLQERELFTSGNLTQSLTQVFTSVGEAANKVRKPICFFIDEMQYMEQEQMGSFIMALHRSNQLGYPIMTIGAGLPKLQEMLSKKKTYSERLFLYRELHSLTDEQTRVAVEEPVKVWDISYDEGSLRRITEVTEGYPFFIQQFCQVIYDELDGNRVSVSLVESCVDKYYEVLDNGFYRLRYARCSDSERVFVEAMVGIGELPCEINKIAEAMSKTVKGVSPIRAKLINKGIIYPVGHGLVDFTVPGFIGFIKRGNI